MKPFILTLTLLASVADAALNWPQFRGPGARGIADSPKIPDTWSATENVAWKTDLPGRGWSSPIVWGNRVFLTSVINKGKLEAPKKGLYFGGNRKAPTSRHEYWVYCLNLKSGEVNWKRRVHSGVPQTGIHVKGSFGAETAVTDGEHVYFYFGDQGIFAFTLDGDPVWQKRQRARKTRFGWGTASSPILHEDRIYLVNDNEEDSYLVALNKRDGKQIWQTERREGSNWSTPAYGETVSGLKSSFPVRPHRILRSGRQDALALEAGNVIDHHRYSLRRWGPVVHLLRICWQQFEADLFRAPRGQG